MTFRSESPGKPIIAFCQRKTLRNHLNYQLIHTENQFHHENFQKTSFLWVFMLRGLYPHEIAVFEAFPRHFYFPTIIDNFSTFFRGYFQPRKNLKKVENHMKYWSFFEFDFGFQPKTMKFDLFLAVFDFFDLVRPF